MKNIKFRKIYQQISEAEMINSIIAYVKLPHILTTKKVEYDPCSTTTQTHYTFINQYKKMLAIDFWIFVYKKIWLTKYKD